MNGNLNELLAQLPEDVGRSVAKYGVRLAIDLLKTLYADLSGEPYAEEATGQTRKPSATGKRIGRPADAKAAMAASWPADSAGRRRRSGWPDDPAVRSREMKRRQEVARAKKAKAARSAAARKRWDNRSAADRKKWLVAMQRGKAQHDKVEQVA